MSMRTWTVSGYGVNAEEVCEASTSDKIAFLKKYLPDTYEDMQSAGEDNGNIDMGNTSDYLDFCGCWIEDFEDDNGNTGFAALFAMAMSENEPDLNIEYYSGEYSEEAAIMMPESLPWLYSDKAKQMSKDDFNAVFKKYLDDLHIRASIDLQSVEFYG